MAGVPTARPKLAIPGRPATSDVSVAADEAVTKLYDEQSRPLLGIAALLVWLAVRPGAPMITGVAPATESFLNSASSARFEVGEYPTIGAVRGLETVSAIAEEIVHDSFAAVHREWRRLRDSDRAVALLRRRTVQGTRRPRDGVQRLQSHLEASDPVPPGDPVPPASLAHGVPVLSTRVLSALRGLPCWQREALVLRYYADLTEAQAAAAMGVTRAAFRGHATRGMTALRRLLDQGHS
jgi:DNA-directed RNA polymerase specialized sigma24 family protein